MMASDVVSRPKYGFNSSYQFNDVAIPSDGRTSFAWYLIYKTIDNCNTAISIKGDSEELRQAQGQALALRAFCYLHLVQHYQFTYLKDKDAPCVPIYTEPTTSGTKPKGKSTVAQVYQQIFDDLNLAQDYLTNYVRKGRRAEIQTEYGCCQRSYGTCLLIDRTMGRGRQSCRRLHAKDIH